MPSASQKFEVVPANYTVAMILRKSSKNHDTAMHKLVEAALIAGSWLLVCVPNGKCLCIVSKQTKSNGICKVVSKDSMINILMHSIMETRRSRRKYLTFQEDKENSRCCQLCGGQHSHMSTPSQ